MQQWTIPQDSHNSLVRGISPSSVSLPSIYPACYPVWATDHALLARLSVAVRWAALFVT